ncbi:MAG: hypothetical protein AAB484_01655 [Patescibacteria group bacterium]
MARELAGKFDQVLNLYKKKSETPLQTIERYVAIRPEYKGVKMTYAGRLDPMAEGVLIVLAGEKNKEREAYTRLDKDYEFEFVLGIETDTYDILGKITKTKEIGGLKIFGEKEIKKALKKYEGKFMQKYPAYSSKVVGGVPLFDLARKDKLDTVVMPEHEVEVKNIEFVSSREISSVDFKKYIEEGINAVVGDFRQKEILKLWDRHFESNAPEKFLIYKVKVTSGSGFYVRQLVSDLGVNLKTGAITISILRTRVGEYGIK